MESMIAAEDMIVEGCMTVVMGSVVQSLTACLKRSCVPPTAAELEACTTAG